jgi:hypothetical protein
VSLNTYSPRALSLPIYQAPGFELPSQATIEPSPPPLRLAPSPIPRVFLITATPLNLHKRFLTGGFLQTAVSDAPPARPPEPTCLLGTGASDTALAFLDSFRFDDHTSRTIVRMKAEQSLSGASRARSRLWSYGRLKATSASLRASSVILGCPPAAITTYCLPFRL